MAHLDADTTNKYAANSASYADPHHLFNIENTIHYRCLITGDFDDYNRYIVASLQKGHDERVFKKLIDEFSLERMDPIRLAYRRVNKKYIVLDGVHRLAIMLHRGMMANGLPSEHFRILRARWLK